MVKEVAMDLGGLMPMSPVDGPPLPKTLGIYWPWKKQGAGGDIDVVIIPADYRAMDLWQPGKLEEIFAGSVVKLEAGAKGNTAQVKVTNKSVYKGTTIKAPYTFAIGISIKVGDKVIKAMSGRGGTDFEPAPTLSLLADETKTLDILFDTPVDVSGSGTCQVFLQDPNDGYTTLATGSKSFEVTALGITPDAAIKVLYVPIVSLQEGGQLPTVSAGIENKSLYTGSTTKAAYRFGMLLALAKGSAIGATAEERKSNLLAALNYAGDQAGVYSAGAAVPFDAGETGSIIWNGTVNFKGRTWQQIGVGYGYSGPAIVYLEVWTTYAESLLARSPGVQVTITPAPISPAGTISV